MQPNVMQSNGFAQRLGRPAAFDACHIAVPSHLKIRKAVLPLQTMASQPRISRRGQQKACAVAQAPGNPAAGSATGDESGVLDVVVVGAGISGLTTALVSRDQLAPPILCSLSSLDSKAQLLSFNASRSAHFCMCMHTNCAAPSPPNITLASHPPTAGPPGGAWRRSGPFAGDRGPRARGR
jgi:hypothetical protein